MALNRILIAALILASTICYFLLRQETYPETHEYNAEQIHKNSNITDPAENIRKQMAEKKRSSHSKNRQEPLEPVVKEQTETGEAQEPVQSSEEYPYEPDEDQESIEEDGYSAEEPVKQKGILPERNWRENMTGMEFSWVPGGRYEMGCGDWTSNCDNDEYPAHEEEVDGFWIGKHEVTVGQYMTFAEKTGTHYPPWMEQGNEYNIHTGSDSYYKYLGKALVSDNYPVVGISWSNAVAFAEWLSQETGYIFRLPTEAEWEYACRSGGNAEYGTSTGNLSPKLANYNPGDYIEDNYGWTAPAGSFPHNMLGIYDMSGNIWEWCLDVYDSNAYKAAAGSISENSVYLDNFHSVYESNLPDILADLKNSDGTRVIRGGSWCTGSRDMRCTNRRGYSRFGNGFCVGFRLMRVQKP